MISDAFSRLINRLYRFEIEKFILNIIEDFFVNVIFVSEAFRKCLLNNYQEPK